MTRALEKSESKIQKICDTLRKDTLEPAHLEAQGILKQAKDEAAKIISKAETESSRIIEQAHQKNEKERAVFQSALEQASKQAFVRLKQQIEEDLFDHEFTKWVERGTADPKLIAKLVDCIVKAIEKEGTDTELSALIPASINPHDVNQLIGEQVLKRLREKSVELGSFHGGAQVRLHGQNLTLDVTSQVLKELLASFVRKDFRELIFVD